MNANVIGAGTTYIYRMEPGDGTRYVFTLTDLETVGGMFSDNGLQEPDSKDLVGADHTYALLSVMQPGNGAYPFSKHALAHPSRYYVRYMREKMCADEYTLAAVLLACSVLVGDPYDLTGAAERMLLAPRLLNGEEIQLGQEISA
jgi:hypothetical protein